MAEQRVVPIITAAFDRIAAAALRALPPEAAHDLALTALSKISPGQAGSFPPSLQTSVFGIAFTHPIGLAAGFDKNARVISAFNRLGWGFTEIGGVTPLPQPGNPKPRLFRLPGRALANHMGFNSEGLDRIRTRLAARPAGIPVFVNLGTNRNTADPVDDSETLLNGLYGLADGFTFNVSCPSAPGLAAMQRPENLAAGIARLRELRDRLAASHAGPPAPLLIKVSPDLSNGQIDEIAEVCMAQRIDGVIATNTSQILRRGLASGPTAQVGGLSGAPLRSRATAVLRALDARFAGTVPLIAVGGIDTAGEAYARIRAGASLVQIYSAMIWEGPRIGSRIARGLARLLTRDGYGSIAEAVGADRHPDRIDARRDSFGCHRHEGRHPEPPAAHVLKAAGRNAPSHRISCKKGRHVPEIPRKSEPELLSPAPALDALDKLSHRA